MENRNKREVGTCYEKMAVTYLQQRGLDVLACNYRCRFGEVDIIAKEKDVVVFFEIKYRKDGDKGLPLEAVTKKKQRIISRCAAAYLAYTKCTDCSARFDVIGILGEEIVWIRNAFEYRG